MTDSWAVIGPCTVAGVAPGGTVSRAALEAAGANIDALIEGGHLGPAEDAAPATSLEDVATIDDLAAAEASDGGRARGSKAKP